FARAIEQRYGVSRASADRLERVTALRTAPPAIARQAAVVAVAHGRLALWSSGAALRLPLEDGGGEEACRRAMRRVFGNVEGEVRLLGVVPAADRRPTIEVWLVRRLRRDLTAMPPGGLQWFAPQDIVARVGSPVLRDAVTLSALAVAARSDLVPEWSAAPLVENSPANRGTTDETSRLTLSELRVPTLPAKTLDAARPAADPVLTPKALTRAPGHSFPHLGDRRLSLAVLLRDGPDGPLHFASVECPSSLPRLVAAPAGGMVPLESMVRAHLGALFPGREVVESHAFRVTRSGDIQLDEVSTASFAQAIADELRRRPWGPVVRIAAERTMPPLLRELLQRELRFEESALQSALGPSDVYEADGPLDLGGLGELAAGTARPDLDYPPFTPRDPFAGDRGVFEALDRGDVLVHHPYDSFGASVERFIAEAADDPDVAAIKLTLYRPGGPSRIAEALRRAAAHGKDVSVFVELKARFDEELNIGWAQS